MKKTKIFLILVIAIAPIKLMARPANAIAPRVEFSTAAPQVDGTNRNDGSYITLTKRQQNRVERFLAHFFPIRQMRREAGSGSSPASLKVTYSVISQEGLRFVLAGYSAEWSGVKSSVNPNPRVNMLAIYRIEPDGPNQVWRGRPWMASYDSLGFSSSKANDKSPNGKNIVLFQEGGLYGKFGLASVFSFRNEPEGIVISDITPSLPCLRAQTRFPFRPLLGREIGLRANVGERHDLMLFANDEEFNISNKELADPHCTWRYKRGRFERIRFDIPTMSNEMGEKN